MAVIISGNGIDMGNNPVSNASQIDGVVINENNENVATTSNLVGFKNYIINGGFDIWQRGDNFTISGETLNADRWRGWHSSGGTISRSGGGPIGFANSVLVSGASTGSALVMQRIEAMNSIKLGTDGNTKITISLYCKADVAGRNIKVAIRIPNASDSWTGYTVPKSAIVGATSTDWTRYVVTFDLDFVYWGGIALDISAISGVKDFYVCGVQLEEGSVATPFENRPIGLELSLCQRYYLPWRYIGGVEVASTTQLNFTLPDIKNMRVLPTLTNKASGEGSGSIRSTYGSSASTAYFPANCCISSSESIVTATLSGLTAGVGSVSIVGTASAEL